MFVVLLEGRFFIAVVSLWFFWFGAWDACPAGYIWQGRHRHNRCSSIHLIQLRLLFSLVVA